MADLDDAFAIQGDVRGPWRTYLDALVPLRPELYRYCCKLTGNIWDAEDLAQETLLRVFGLLGKIDADLANPRAYLLRAATNAWIDKARRNAREQAHLALASNEEPAEHDDLATNLDAHGAASELLQRLHPSERAALVLKDVLDLSLRETAQVLDTSVGAIKSALHRGRGRLEERIASAQLGAPSKDLVERFMLALSETDLETLKEICAVNLAVELVGGAETASLEDSKTFFEHAHFVWPELGFGENPWWKTIVYHGEPIVVGFRTLNDVEGVNEVHRLTELDGRITRVRCYCFCPDTLAALANELGENTLDRPLNPYRSPS
ncbi:MAG: RNA polymerase sigma factor [Gammaproteobacteria bacterium]|nr:RNA polymerase sigma factor [Gammaproteobacteria bacterium]